MGLNREVNGRNMDIFEKHFEMLRKSEEAFKKYSTRTENGLKIPDDREKDFCIEGRNLLSVDVITYFLEVRSIYHYNIVNMKLKDYSFPEWVVCLEENVLLEYALPVFSRVLQEYPMLCGMNCEWQIMYEIAKIKEDFWLLHKEWREFFVGILRQFCSKYAKEKLIEIFSEEYSYQFREFISMS